MLARLLDSGYDALAFDSAQAGLEAVVLERPDMVLCRASLPEMSGMEVLTQLRDAGNECEYTQFFLLSPGEDPQLCQRHIEKGADGSFPENIEFNQLRALMGAQLRMLERQTRRHERELIKLYKTMSEQNSVNSGGQADNSKKEIDRNNPIGLADTESFAEIACERMKAAQDSGGAAHLTLIEVPGLAELASDPGDTSAIKLFSQISELLRANSEGGNSAGLLEKDRFGLVHGDDVQSKNLQQSLDQIIQRSGFHEQGLSAVTANLPLAADGLSPQDAARALVYAVKHFAGQGSKGFTINSLKEGVSQLVEDTVARIAELRGNITGGELELHYQPIVELNNRALHHYEALARFPGGGSPYSSITFAEQIGLVEELDLSICRKIIEFVEKNQRSGREIKIAMNVSAQSIESGVFVTAMRRILSKLGGARKQVMLEITESVQIQNYEEVANLVKQLRMDGHHICLDDFGAGDSNFNYLRAFEVDYVKIDGVYVRDVLRSSRDQAFIRAISRLCKEIKVKTVAEFVEDEKQALTLHNLGVDFGQGYLFGKPSANLV